MNNATVALDFTNQQEVARVLLHTPIVTSYHTGWKGLTFTHYRHPPHKTVEHCLLQHSLVVTAPKHCFRAERRLDGKVKQYAHGNGRIDIIPAFLNHWTNWDQDIEFSVIAICPALLNQTTQELMQQEIDLIPQVSIDDPVIGQLALALKTEIQTGCMSSRLYGESLGAAIAARLATNYALHKPLSGLKVHGLAPLQLRRVIDYIQINLAQNLSILDLATLAGISASHFSRAFKRSTGIPPYQYLIQQRIEQAKQLLKQQNVPISDIAIDCGFANQTHLTKVFRQQTGLTPKGYQKRCS